MKCSLCEGGRYIESVTVASIIGGPELLKLRSSKREEEEKGEEPVS